MVSFSVRGVAKGRQKSMKGQSQPCWPGLHDLQDICRRNFDFLGTGASFTSEKILRTKKDALERDWTKGPWEENGDMVQ